VAEQYVTTTISNAKGRSTLASSYTSGGTSLVLQTGHGARFPSTGNFRVGVGDSTTATYELFKVTSRSTDTLTVVGAQENTPANNHSSGDAVIMVYSALAIDGIRADQAQVGIVANLPASGMKAGDKYYTTNGLYSYVYDGSNWQALFGSRIVTAPVAGDFSWVNQGDATLSSASGGLTITGPGNASTNLRIQKKTAPAAPWTASALIAAFTGAADNHRVGLVMRENATGKLLTLSTGGGATSNAGITVDRWNSATSFSAQPKATNIPVQNFQSGLWIRAKYDSTNVKFFLSPDGFIWSEYYTESKTAFFTTAPDEVGIFINVEGTGTPDLINTLIHFTF
jgi:hypothetical protein